MTRVAAVDVGSNSVLLAVGEALPGGDLTVLYESFRATRLSGGMDRSGGLLKTAVERTLEALAECRRKAEIFGVSAMKAVATAAVREARNPDAFLVPAEETLGVPIEVVSGGREAELTFLGVAGSARAEPLAILDVGGRSTELLLTGDGRIERADSLPLGAVRLRESLSTEDELADRVETLRVLPFDLDPAEFRGREAIAVGGTATTLAAMRIGLRRYDGEQIEGLPLGRDEILELVRRVLATPPDERNRIPGLSASRADIIASGGWLLARILDAAGFDRVAISSRGLRHGILWELVREQR